MRKLPLKDKKFRKIPLLISKWSEGNVKGWRAEIADNYADYKMAKFSDINFEDVGFHFYHCTLTHDLDSLVFYSRKDAVEAANYVNETYLKMKGKVWYL